MKYRTRITTLMAALAALSSSQCVVHGQAAPVRTSPAAEPTTPAGETSPRASTIPVSPASKRDDDDTIVLSPFEVNASEDTGYAAASSLAGNRLNTDLKDVGSAISVVTAQMMRDLSATNNESLLLYTTSSEVGNIYGNMANAGSGTQLDETSRFTNPTSNNRIRGLAAADNTIDYFVADIPWDSYNVDRVDMQRGPNSMLFGLGGPAGVINAGTKTATFRNKGQVEVKYSRFGSLRTTIDLNQVLIPKQLAIHVDGLYGCERRRKSA